MEKAKTMTEVALMQEHDNRMSATTDLLLEIQKTLILLNDLIQQLVTPILVYKSTNKKWGRKLTPRKEN